MSATDVARRLERGLVQSVFAPCARALVCHLQHIRPLTRVLDVGCGSGIALRVAKQHFVTIKVAHGLDCSPHAIAVANEVAGDLGISFSVGRAEELEATSEYDAILCQHTIQHVQDAPLAVRRMHEALRDGGVLVLAAWPALDKCPAYDFLYTASGERDRKVAKMSTDLSTMIDYVRNAGFFVELSMLEKTETEPVTPKHILDQYLEGSLGWDGKVRPVTDEASLTALAERLGWAEPARRFGIGMHVVVARR